MVGDFAVFWSSMVEWVGLTVENATPLHCYDLFAVDETEIVFNSFSWDALLFLFPLNQLVKKFWHKVFTRK